MNDGRRFVCDFIRPFYIFLAPYLLGYIVDVPGVRIDARGVKWRGLLFPAAGRGVGGAKLCLACSRTKPPLPVFDV